MGLYVESREIREFSLAKMGNKQQSLLGGSPRKTESKLVTDTVGNWLCGACGFANEPDAAKCKVCQSSAPPSSVPAQAKKSTFFKSLSGKRNVASSISDASPVSSSKNLPTAIKSSQDESPRLTPRPFEDLKTSDEGKTMNGKKKSEPKMNSAMRMRTLVISKGENHALVFLKPGVPKTEAVRDAIEEHFLEFKCQLTSEGMLNAEDIAEKGIIDNHYAALAKNALDLNPGPRELAQNVKDQYVQTFGVPYSDDKVLTLGQFQKMCPDVSSHDIDKAWANGKKVKLAGGIYVGRLEGLESINSIAPSYRPLLIVNGFYAAMRNDYITPGNQVLYFTVEWKEKDLSWKDFRSLVVGATDPTKADPKSLRGKMRAHWKQLGLKEAPTIQNNCVHASAGPIEAMRERATWIGLPLEKDPFAQKMLSEGVPLDMIESLSNNCVVTVDDKTGPAFDIFEDLDSGKVIQATLRLAAEGSKSRASSDSSIE